MLYPLKFNPICKEKIWGGQKIKTKLGIDYGELPNCGEVWMISGVEGNPSLVSNGFLKGNELNEVLEVYMGDLVGEKIFSRFGNEFPLLIKIIDSNDWLSIQVHPDDELARKRSLGNGKTEMWYMLDAEPDAELISGFSQDVKVDTYLEHLKNNSIKDLLNVVHVEKGDVFYIPAGRVHALGPGCWMQSLMRN